MKIAYLITAKGNPLYEGKFHNGKKYLTFGQHSFIYDLVLAIVSNQINIEIYVDGVDVFPLTESLSSLNILISELRRDSKIDADIIIFDTVSDDLLHGNYNGYKVGIIHNYMIKHSELFYSVCDAIICMTPYAVQKQNTFYPSNKYCLIRQGVFCNRFNPQPQSSFYAINSVLFYSRMDKYKGYAYYEIIQKFIDLGIHVSILGSGELFDYFKTFFSNKIKCFDHIPCQDIPQILNDVDLIVSNGRGVMEGLSANKPTIATGIRYCGLITADNIIEHRDRNFTGAYILDKDIDLEYDMSLVSACYKCNPLYFSNLAKQYLCVETFLHQLIKLKLKDNVCI